MINRDFQNIVKKLIKSYRIKVSSETIEKYVLTYPFDSRLSAVSDAFDEWNIDHAAIRIDIGLLSKIRTPFLVQLYDFDLVLVLNVDDNKITVYNGKWNEHWNYDYFKRKWTDLIIAIEPNDISGEVNYKSQKRKSILNYLSNSILCLTIISISLNNLYKATDINYFQLIIHIAILMTGSIVCGFIYSIEHDISPDFVNKLCRVGKSFNCKEVLKSRSSMMFGIVPWGDIGLVYFTGSLLSIMLFANQPLILSYLRLINVIAIPFSIYFLIYQFIKFEKRCLFCLVTQALIISQFLVFSFLGNINYQSFENSNILIFQLTIYLALYYIIRRNSIILDLKKELNTSVKREKSIRRNPEIIRTLLGTENSVNIDPNDMFILGNSEGTLILTVVLNLTCDPCARLYKLLFDLIQKNNDIKIQCIFIISEHESDQEDILKYFGYLNHYKIGSLAKSILTWYDTININCVEDIFQIHVDGFDLGKFIKKHKKLYSLLNIKHTPTLFVNGRDFSKILPAEDVCYWIPYIRQYCNNYKFIN